MKVKQPIRTQQHFIKKTESMVFHIETKMVKYIDGYVTLVTHHENNQNSFLKTLLTSE